jgi:hypothetical protein
MGLSAGIMGMYSSPLFSGFLALSGRVSLSMGWVFSVTAVILSLLTGLDGESRPQGLYKEEKV